MIDIFSLDSTLLELINNMQINLINKTKINKGTKDTFDYDLYESNCKKWNFFLYQIYSEMEFWNNIFNEPHTLSEDTIQKIIQDNLKIKKMQDKIISDYVLSNYFL